MFSIICTVIRIDDTKHAQSKINKVPLFRQTKIIIILAILNN